MEKLVWRLQQIVNEKLVADKVTHMEVEQILRQLQSALNPTTQTPETDK